MTEKEKMLAGEIYDCGDPELIRRWHYAKELQLRYNNAPQQNMFQFWTNLREKSEESNN